MKVMSGLLILALFLAGLLMQGCETSTTTNAVVCNRPYILVGSSCCLDANDNSICDKDEVQEPVVQEPVDNTPAPTPETPQTEFKLVKGDSVLVSGKAFTLVDFSVYQGKVETEVRVDGLTRTIYETKKPEIVNGLRVTPISVGRLQTYIVIDIRPLKLGPDEYLLQYGFEQVVLGKVVTLKDIQDEGGVLVGIVDGEDSGLFIMPGDTKSFDGLKITNVESFRRPTSAERYVILKIEQA